MALHTAPEGADVHTGARARKLCPHLRVPCWCGSEVHVMLALCGSSHQIVVADEEFYGTNISPFAAQKVQKLNFWEGELWVVSLNCCDALHAILETGARWYAVDQGTRWAPDTHATHPSSSHARSDPPTSLGSWVATYAVTPLHGSAPEWALGLASSGAVTPGGHTPMTTNVVSRTARQWRQYRVAPSLAWLPRATACWHEEAL
jgi:hypothetical protein